MTELKEQANQLKVLVLIDGSSYIFRAYHAPALSKLTTTDGKPSGTIFGFNRSLNAILNHYNPEACCVVFDPLGRTVRHDWFDAYKANRPETPLEIIESFAAIQELLSYRNIPQLTIEKQEADDVIGSLAKLAEKQGWIVKIVTRDKDFAQLVAPKIHLSDTKGGAVTEMDVKGVKEKFKVLPDQIADWLALKGDSVDNIPGVPGIGPKKAADLLKRFGNLDGVLQNLSLIPGKIGDALAQDKENIPLYQRLTQINQEIKLPLSIASLKRPKATNHQLVKLKDFYSRMDFRQELWQLEKEETTPNSKQDEPLEVKQDTLSLISLLEAATAETELQVLFIENLSAIYQHQGKKLYIATEFAECEQAFNQTQARLFAIDWKSIVKKTKVQLSDKLQDIMLMSYVLNSGKRSHTWPALVVNLDSRSSLLEEDIKELRQKLKVNVSLWSDKERLKSCQNRLLNQHALTQLFLRQLNEAPHLEKVYTELENPLKKCLETIEKNGVYIDKQTLKTIDQQLTKDLSAVQQDTYQLGGEPFNIDSPKQVSQILYEKLGLPVLKKTSSGSPSTNEQVLKEMADRGYEICNKIIDYRSISKLQSTYAKGLQKHIDSESRIYTTLNQAVTSTGRLSSSEPNLQNIPIRTTKGRLIRKAFAVPQGQKMITADYSQIEFRILAHQSGDEKLIEAFKKNLDIHRLTAAKIFDIEQESVDMEKRRYAKTINFGLVYGMSAFSLAKQLQISVEQAESWIKQYFSQFPKILNYIEETKAFAKQKGYVETIFNRRIYFPEINNRNHTLRSYAERAAINAPIQGAAADLIKQSMLAIQNKIEDKLDIKMILQIHDELLFEAQENKAQGYAELIKTIMQSIQNLSVPLIVDIGIADNWHDAH